MSHSNTWYGQEAVLRQYCGARLPYTIGGLLEHGWEPNFREGINLRTASPEAKARLHLVFNERNLGQALEHGYNAVAIGSPIIYLRPQLPSRSSDKSLLLFPSHSIPEFPFVSPMDRFKVYLQDVAPLLRCFWPVTICLYWFDYRNSNIRRMFEGNGLSVTTVGHRDDPDFLYNLRDLMYRYSYVSSNELATAIIYALYWRRRAFVYGTQREVKELRWEPALATMTLPIDEVIAVTKATQSRYPELRWEKFDGRSHWEIGAYEVGLEFKRSPQELREILGWTPMRFVRQVPYRCYCERLAGKVLPEAIKEPLKKLTVS